ncbi:hypothetical protein KGM_202376 [Danaus plexippus plexippus]|uniref:Uncharacterized protein n=1 Tax=Danaus plexippus plexippus TaxID=278856 RepID=A0A212FFI8_DANPL|nr:hypothetical protein KGM_202376 [Danaus plexippus plexippus]
MDRCRCDEYRAAIESLRFYTVGTHRPDIIDNYDRSAFTTVWMPHGVDYVDFKFSKPRAYKIIPGTGNTQTNRQINIQQMWCPYMTPVKE